MQIETTVPADGWNDSLVDAVARSAALMLPLVPNITALEVACQLEAASISVLLTAAGLLEISAAGFETVTGAIFGRRGL